MIRSPGSPDIDIKQFVFPAYRMNTGVRVGSEIKHPHQSVIVTVFSTKAL